MNTPEHGKQTLNALKWSYAGSVGRVFFQMIIQMILARILGPQAFGEATASFFILSFGWLMAEAGFGSALIQKLEITSHDIAYAMGWVLLVSSAVGMFVALFSTYIAYALGNSNLSSLVLVSGLLIPLQAISNIPMSLMRRKLNMKLFQIIQVSGYIFAYGIVGIPLAWCGAGAWTLVIAFALQSFINLICGYLATRFPLHITLKGEETLRTFGLRVTGTNIANWAIDNIDRILISRYWGINYLGEYAAASNLSRAPVSLLVSSTQAVTFAAGARLQNNPDKLRSGYLAAICVLSLISFPIFSFLAIYSNLIIHLVYGNKWSGAATLFSAFCVGLPFFAILSITGPTLWAIGAVGSEMKVQILCAIILFIGFVSLIGIPLNIAVWLVPLIYAFRSFLLYLLLAKKLEIGIFSTIRALFGGVVFAILTILISYLMSKIFHNIYYSAFFTAFLVFLCCVFSIRFATRQLLISDLIVVLLNRREDSNFIKIICQYLALNRLNI